MALLAFLIGFYFCGRIGNAWDATRPSRLLDTGVEVIELYGGMTPASAPLLAYGPDDQLYLVLQWQQWNDGVNRTSYYLFSPKQLVIGPTEKAYPELWVAGNKLYAVANPKSSLAKWAHSEAPNLQESLDSRCQQIKRHHNRTVGSWWFGASLLTMLILPLILWICSNTVD